MKMRRHVFSVVRSLISVRLLSGEQDRCVLCSETFVAVDQYIIIVDLIKLNFLIRPSFYSVMSLCLSTFVLLFSNVYIFPLYMWVVSPIDFIQN